MRTVGQMLKEARVAKNLTLADVEKTTKVRSKFLAALEADDYKKMPELPYIQGFLKLYSDFLGLRTYTIMAIFRRQYTSRDKGSDERIEEPLDNQPWQITPNKVIFVAVVLLVIGLFVYVYTQYRTLHTPPPLTVEQPSNEAIVTNEIVAVFGETDRDATLTINNSPVLVEEDGKFYKDINLVPGQNTIVIESVSRVGEKTQVTRTVTRTPPN